VGRTGRQNRIDMKLRAAFILPAIAIEIVIAVLAVAIPSLFQPLIISIPVVGVIALGALFVVEGNRRRSKPD